MSNNKWWNCRQGRLWSNKVDMVNNVDWLPLVWVNVFFLYSKVFYTALDKPVAQLDARPTEEDSLPSKSIVR